MDFARMSDVQRMRLVAHNHKAVAEAAERRDQFLIELRRFRGSIDAACEAMGRKRSWYQSQRQKDPIFAQKATAIRKTLQGGRRREEGEERATWELGFAAFRLKYFGMETPWFQQVWVDAVEDLRPGNILLALWPPEHGKSTLFEDYSCYKIATDPSYRVLVGTEEVGLGRKFLRRIRNRMEDDGPFPDFVDDFGPFSPRTGSRRSAESSRASQQPWGADFFDVLRKSEHDERNFSMEARGVTSAISGARTDHLHLDDIQSVRSLGKNETVWRMLTQDWLPRPGESGIITINGTRVDEDDIYEKMFEYWDDDILEVLKFPAVIADQATGKVRPLWEREEDTGAGFTLEMLDRLRRKLGSNAVWDRTYMQEPTASTGATFTDEILAWSYNPTRSVHDIPAFEDVVWITVDPSIGGKNCVMSFAVTSEHLGVLNIDERIGLQSNEEIMASIEGEIVRCQINGARVVKVIIEENFFQKGLINDDRLKDMRKRYGFVVEGHRTGVNKYDETIGVASMPSAFMAEQIDFPWAEDEMTRHQIGELVRQLKAWKPYIKGDVLRQDRVMCLWFAYVQWCQLRLTASINPERYDGGPKRKGLPWAPTDAGLLLPSHR